ncbi:MAG: hypothetical protein JSU79_04275, partial [Dehalococcoidales bacterium]
MAVMVKADSNQIDYFPIGGTSDIMSEWSSDDSDDSVDGTAYLSDFMVGLESDNTTKTGCSYTISANGTVTQSGCP